MRHVRGLAASLLALIAAPAVCFAAVIGGYYARSTTIGSSSPRPTAGNSRSCWPASFPAHRWRSSRATCCLPCSRQSQTGAHLHLRQAFAADAADYRLVLVFDPANNLNSDPVCAGVPPRFRPGTPGRFYVYAIYCRNDQAMSQTTAWTDATGPTDPRIERLFRELFPVIFSEQQNRWALSDPNLR
jgi:hypothetical protein